MTEINLMGKKFMLYSSIEEAERWGERVRYPADARAGDYVMTGSGFVVPVFGWRPCPGHRNGEYWLSHLGGNMYFDHPEHHEGDIKYVFFDASKYVFYEHRLDIWEMQVANMVAAGIEPKKAVKMCYKGQSPQYRVVERLFMSKRFLHYMFNETEGFKMLKAELEKLGITEATLAEQIAVLLKEKKPPTMLKLWALNTLKETFDVEPEKKRPGSFNQQINNFVLPEVSAVDRLRVEQTKTLLSAENHTHD